MKRFGYIFLALFLLLPFGLWAQDAAGSEELDTALMEAYQREFIFLDNEIRLLEDRLSEVKKTGDANLVQARGHLRALEGRLVTLTSDVDKRQDDLVIVESLRDESSDTGATLENIVVQASSRLENLGMETYSPNPDLSADEKLLDELEYSFGEALKILPKLGSVYKETGKFFLDDGQEVSGQIVHIGCIAGYGVSEQASGTLAPAGGGRLRLVDSETAGVAKALAFDRQPETLPLFLYENLDELAELAKGSNLKDTVKGGGLIGVVILLMGGLGLILVIIRALSIARVGRSKAENRETVFSLVRGGKMKEAAIQADSMGGAMGRVLAATIRGLMIQPKKIDDVIAEAVLNEQPPLARFRVALSVFASVAPLMGLLGTVTGMISTFDVITQYGTGDPKLLSGGISEALITTELGLAVAIPLLLLGNLLTTWADRVTSDMEISALRGVNIVIGGEEEEAS